MSALRECPFCGGAATEGCEYEVWQIECGECGASAPCVDSDLEGDAAKEARRIAWNKRADDRYTLTELGAAMLERKK